MNLTTATQDFTAIAARQTTTDLNEIITLNQDLLTDHATGAVVLTDEEHALAVAVLAAAQPELAHRQELHTRALEEHTNRPHLVSLIAATRYLATLIREENLDGEDIAALQNADFDGVAPRHYAGAGERTYRFLCEASDTFERHGDLLLRTATVAILGW